MKRIKLYTECYDPETGETYLVQLEPSEAIAVARELVRPEGWNVTLERLPEEAPCKT